MTFGSDFVLYKKGPPFYHSSFAVIIKVVDKDTLQESSLSSRKEVSSTWSSFAASLRLATSTNKQVLFCYVIIPNDIKETDLSVEVLKKFQIQEVLASRWTTPKDHEKEMDDIDCDF